MRIRWHGLLALLIAFPAVVARGGLPRPYGGEIRLESPKNRVTDPARAAQFFQMLLARQVHETLLRLGADGTPRPLLLVRPPEISEDGREFGLELRPQLTDQRGLSLEAQDVVASWQRLLAADTGSPHWWLLAPIEGALEFRRGAASISGLQVEHRLRLRVRLRYALPAFVQVLGVPQTAPLSLASRSSSVAGTIGSGPFAWQKTGAGEVLGPFPGNPAGRPFVDRVVLVSFSSPRESLMALGAGRLEIALPAPGKLETSAPQTASPPLWPVLLVLNTPKLSSLPENLAAAIDAALDRKALAEYAAGEGAVPMHGLLDFSSTNQAGPGGGRSEVRAWVDKLALATHGVAPVLSFLVRRGDDMERLTAERIQVDLMNLGLVISLVELDEPQYAERLRAGDYHFSLARPYLPVSDDSLRLAGLIAWLAGGETEALQMMEELLTRLEKLQEQKCGETLIQELARNFQSRLPALPLFRHSVKLFLSPALRDISWEAGGLPDLAGCWLLPQEKAK